MSRQISKSTKDIQTLLVKYAETPVVDDSFPQSLTYKEVIDLNDSVWDSLCDLQNTSVIPNSVLVQVQENLALIRRSQEETLALYKDMKQVCSARLAEHGRIDDAYQSQVDSPLGRAIQCQLVCLGWNIETILSRYIDTFTNINFPKAPTKFRAMLQFEKDQYRSRTSFLPEAEVTGESSDDEHLDDWQIDSDDDF